MNAPPRKTHIANLEPLGDAAPFVLRILEIMGPINLFEGFEKEEVEQLSKYMTCYHAPEGTEIIREGDTGDFLLLIIEGNIEIVKIGSNGLPSRVGMAGPGKTLGEMSVIDGEPRFASCIADSEVLMAVLDR
ncbi:MAG TPA: cyclic nucleotide-binding domain-containing protein, partial [Rhodocyclaceae bacterium]